MLNTPAAPTDSQSLCAEDSRCTFASCLTPRPLQIGPCTQEVVQRLDWLPGMIGEQMSDEVDTLAQFGAF